MKKGKIKIIVIIVILIALGGLGFIYRDSILQVISSIGGSKECVYVEKVSELNGDTIGLTSRFGGIIETQDIHKVKFDTAKVISEIHVKVGDTVEVGQDLFTYNTRELQLEIDQKKLEIESMTNEIEGNQQQINVFTKQMEGLPVDEQFEFQAEIQNLNNTISQLQYDIGCIELEINNLSKDLETATVKSEVSGTVKEINENMNDFSDSDVLITILQGKEYRVKGSVDEQSIWNLSEEMDMIIRSRVDETKTWTGKIVKIDTAQIESSQNEYYEEDEVIKATKYPFYVSIDNPEGLLLGQHVYLEINNGETEIKEGLWIPSGYIVQEESVQEESTEDTIPEENTQKGNTYVWAANAFNRLEKRVIELGEYDADFDQYQILSGLTEDDYIAWPVEGLYAGVTTVTNIEDANWGEESIGTEDWGTEIWEDDYSEDEYIEEELWETEYVEGTEW